MGNNNQLITYYERVSYLTRIHTKPCRIYFQYHDKVIWISINLKNTVAIWISSKLGIRIVGMCPVLERFFLDCFINLHKIKIKVWNFLSQTLWRKVRGWTSCCFIPSVRFGCRWLFISPFGIRQNKQIYNCCSFYLAWAKTSKILSKATNVKSEISF